ncbi:hypothetical protein A3O11_07370 [Ligilactobacillus aviarius]|uniref:hypothetical protein n=1 Tax=Ligilactobacillus aviarius TaxID=1606 RepID=UPI0007D9B725|nr:hypothetical protein [Ligilactobacillus aviarius]OAQ02408.1 hypothetical protein A3O10_07370 [Ligilactobacillus aviarius]OAQ02897.1 hypothetical protein A3O11_07370 [Ligilactobacillus aviarius]OAQ06288.1 hypothetical protein A3O15_02765 [Ligilactobacillus aviarius]OAS74891.1 hypothetical protein A3O17_01455 [Ligilactobacillus aviarius]OAS78791.1 hypothetical protein A3O18_06260 [Ligilactobacillus aviarius]
MTTNIFQRKFILNAQEAASLVDALENSQRVDIKLKRKAEFITDSEKIHAELDDVFKKLGSITE